MRASPLDQIEYLVGRKFPDHRLLARAHPIRPGGLPNLEPSTYQLERLNALEAYKRELLAKPKNALNDLVTEEMLKEHHEWLAKIEREEQERFFNQPNANADFVHWSKAVYWTLDEALALAFGKAPEVVRWENVKPYIDVSAFARQFARVRDLAIRAKNWQQLFDPVMPGIFLAWARRFEVPVPESLVKTVEARGIVVADWKDIYDELKVRFDSVEVARAKITAENQSLKEERDALKSQVTKLEDEIRGWQFDESAEHYPSELDVAMQAWWAVTKNPDNAVTPKQQLQAWLEQYYPKLSVEARERIAIVCNWGKRGGRPTRDST